MILLIFLAFLTQLTHAAYPKFTSQAELLSSLKLDFPERTIIELDEQDIQEYAVVTLHKSTEKFSICQGPLEQSCNGTMLGHLSVSAIFPHASSYQVHFTKNGNVRVIQHSDFTYTVLYSNEYDDICPLYIEDSTLADRRRSFILGQYSLYSDNRAIDQSQVFDFCKNASHGQYNNTAQVDTIDIQDLKNVEGIEETFDKCMNSNDTKGSCVVDVDSGEIIQLPGKREYSTYHRANVTVYSYCCESPEQTQAHLCYDNKTKNYLSGCITLLYNHLLDQDYYLPEKYLSHYTDALSMAAIPILHSNDKFFTRQKLTTTSTAPTTNTPSVKERWLLLQKRGRETSYLSNGARSVNKLISLNQAAPANDPATTVAPVVTTKGSGTVFGHVFVVVFVLAYNLLW